MRLSENKVSGAGKNIPERERISLSLIIITVTKEIDITITIDSTITITNQLNRDNDGEEGGKKTS